LPKAIIPYVYQKSYTKITDWLQKLQKDKKDGGVAAF
jgi:hypothetical protein